MLLMARSEMSFSGTFDEQVNHVVRLVEQDGGVAPCALLIAPVRELRGNNRIDVCADL
jgi:hypothetical protein